LLELALNLLVAVRGLGVSLRFRPQVVLERMTPYGPAGFLLSRLLGVPLVLHLDAPFAAERAFRGDRMFAALHREMVRTAARRAVVVAVGSEASLEHYQSLGVPPDRFVFLRNGVLADELACARDGEVGAPVIGFAGSMARWHRVDLLVEAVATLRLQGLPVSLVLVGMGEEYHRVADQVARLALGDVVRFTGPVSREDALAAIEGFQVAVLPHTLSTGSPMKLFDYAARRVARVAPDLPNLRQVWSEGTVAFFPPGDLGALVDTLRQLMHDGDLRRSLAEAAWRLAAERYTWERQLAEVLARASVAPGARDEVT
jgi:glycosyltransferase involved in cell wall biosynthesis